MKTNFLRIFLVTVMLALVSAMNGFSIDKDQIAKRNAFEQVFGELAKLDSAMVQKVKNDVPGKRHYVDKDGDGKPEEVWFIDIEPRHTARKSPILVKVVDENGNLEMGKEPEKYGDLWIADWHVDGLVDAIISYRDLDGDGDLDIMEWFTYGRKNWRVGFDGLRALVSTDDGDDNLLDYDIDYVYYQIPCQSHTHFGGNESFVVYYLNEQQDKWVPHFENPFYFYDGDDNGITEEVIRVEGIEALVKSIRWSFNVEQVLSKPRDFDVSISACAKGWTEEKDRQSDFTMILPEKETEHFVIRGIPTGPVLKRTAARDYLRTTTWERAIMTWNENNLNIAYNDPNDVIERWEGVINAASTDSAYIMPRIGAPDCGPYNKRYELVLSPKGPNEYYYLPADGRVHMKYSDKTWIKVDYNYDNVVDMSYAWSDENKDGVMDKITIDTNNDGQADDSWNLDVSEIKPVRWMYIDLNQALAAEIRNEPANKYYLVKALAAALESVKKGAGEHPVLNLVERSMRDEHITADISRRLINSNKTILYYLSIIQDSQIAQLKNMKQKSKSFWKKFDAARTKGDTQAMTKLVRRSFRLGVPDQDYKEWITRLRMEESKKRVAWNNQWLPPNWGWESEKAAFRFYFGHFDAFGKHEGRDTLMLPKIAEGKSYHLDQNDWGMDILHVGKTGGCGGVTLYVNGVAYPVRNETGKGNPAFTSRLVKENNDTVTVEFIATGVGPEKAPYTVTLRPSAIGGRYDSPVEVLVEGGTPGQKIELGIGLVRLGNETWSSNLREGIIGSRGFQDPAIGWIGLGIIFPTENFVRFDEQPAEHLVVLRCETGVPLVYHIRTDWLRGHQFSCCPSAQDWFDTLMKTSAELSGK
ncbi:MAG: DUF4861 family protein [Paludibacter sp.]|nr:DUF4861 family protein [Paludibacter sp.]